MTTLEFYNKFQPYEKQLIAYAFTLTNNRDEANDLYQETVFRILKNWKQFKEGSNLKAWSYTIMKNSFINKFRRKTREYRLQGLMQERVSTSFDASVRNEGEANIMLDELKALINRVEEVNRIPFLLHFQGYKYEEIAEELNIPLGTIKSRIFFARKRLKKMITNRYPDRFAS